MKKSIFALSVISVLFSSQSFAQISTSNEGYSLQGCTDQGSYNLCSFSNTSNGSVSNNMNTTIESTSTVQSEGSITITSSTPSLVSRPKLTDDTSSSAYISSNNANNNEYSNTVYSYNTYYNGKRFYKVVSCDVYNTVYFPKNSSYGTGSSIVNPNNRKGSQTSQYKEDNGWASIEFFDPTTNKSLGWGGALIAKQEVWFNNVLDHYEGDSISGTKYALGQPNDGWNVVHVAGQCEYPFDPIFSWGNNH